MPVIPQDLLNTLVAVAESQNFREAAERLGVSQPGVSLKLRALERLLPVAIFQLQGRRKVLTHYGIALCEIARKNLNSMSRDLEELHRLYGSEESLTLRIGGREEILEFALSRIIFGGRIDLVALSGMEASEKILRREIDFAITYEKPDSLQISAKRLFKSGVEFVIHENLLGKRKLTIELVKDPKFLMETPSILYRDGLVIEPWMKHLNLSLGDLRVRYAVQNWPLAMSLVAKARGFSIVPDYALSSVKEVRRLKMPKEILPELNYFVLFDTGLRKLAPYRRALESLSQP